MGGILTLGDLQKHFEQTRDRLSRDKQDILAATPLPTGFDRDKYSFSYFRAERVSLEVITQSLSDVSWLPMQLDPKSEILLQNRTAMKKWLNSNADIQPDGEMFGNDFVHALTRTAITHGWNSLHFRALATRIGTLFHDLSCLIGLIYYGVWMSENGIEGLSITNLDDLERTAQEIEQLTQSPEITNMLRQRKLAKANQEASSKEKKQKKPILRVIENSAWEQPTHMH